MTKTSTKPKTKTTAKPKTTTCKCKTKNSKKGFTLIELLAVIIILAIVVGITIPAIMNTVGNARQSAFNSAAQSCADWIERQYQLYLVNKTDSALNTSLKTLLTSAETYKTGTTISKDPQNLTAPLVEACGLKTTNVAVAGTKFKLNNGRVCLILQAESKKDYAGYGTANASGGTGTNTDYMLGGACTGVTF